jgi:thymidylate synthase ThyX
MSMIAIDAEKVQSTVRQLLADDVPVLEHIHFSFALRNISISLREQLVRHRIGVKIGDAIGIDQIPDLADSSFWSQTSRMVPASNFASEGRYITPKSIDDRLMYNDVNLTTANEYKRFMHHCETFYQELLDAGVPMEDARQILPLGYTHNIVWTLSLKALKHIIGKRACWIAQYGLWGEVIQGMVRELTKKVHPIFNTIVAPPCFTNGKFSGCPIHQINVARLSGEDPYPPCPIWSTHTEDKHFPMPNYDHVWHIHDGDLVTNNEVQEKMMERMRKEYEELWGRNSDTGELIKGK